MPLYKVPEAFEKNTFKPSNKLRIERHSTGVFWQQNIKLSISRISKLHFFSALTNVEDLSKYAKIP